MVLQVQVVINVFASLFCLLGMLINHDFKIIQREAREYELGERKYYSVLVTCAICWQLCFVGILGMIHYTSSLFAGITSAVILPLTEVAAVIVYHEKFTGEKGMSLALCLWGFLSYFTGEYKNKMKAHANHEIATKVSNNDNV